MSRNTQREFRESVSQATAKGRPLRIDAASGVVKRVKVLGFSSLNRRRYTAEAARAGLEHYEGVACNLDHPATPHTTRSVRDRFGVLEGATVDSNGIWANLRYNPRHEFAESFRWWCENDPGAIGLSHNAIGQGHDEDGVFVVERIVGVRSVDLVAEPATTRGMFEGVQGGKYMSKKIKTRECDHDDGTGEGSEALMAKVKELLAAGVPMADIMAALDAIMADGGPSPGKVADQIKEALDRVRRNRRLGAALESATDDDLRRYLEGRPVKESNFARIVESRRKATAPRPARRLAESNAGGRTMTHEDFVRHLRKGY